MLVSTCESSAALLSSVAAHGFAFARGSRVREMLAPYGTLANWTAFRESWRALSLDPYMADGGRYRRRRHAVYHAPRDGAIVRAPHQPHYQSLAYNPLHGGIERWFDPILDAIGDERRPDSTMRAVLEYCRATFGALAPDTTSWRVEVHQFRIEARPREQGRPTPEGLHRDGVDYVLVLLVDRHNIASGVTSIHGLDGTPLGSFTLADPLDAAIVDDRRVAHGVTPVQPIDPERPAYRDVLVVTFAGDPQK